MIESGRGPVAELADAHGLGPCPARGEGSSPFRPTKEFTPPIGHSLFFRPRGTMLLSLDRDADNPHVEQREYAEEPCMTFDSPHTTTSAVILSFPLFGSGLESIPVGRLKK